jgi:hypothetical protein
MSGTRQRLEQMMPQDPQIFVGSDKQQSSPKASGDVRIRLLGPLQLSAFLAAPVLRRSKRIRFGTFLARTFLQTEGCIPQTGGLLGKIMTLQSFGLAQ